MSRVPIISLDYPLNSLLSRLQVLHIGVPIEAEGLFSPLTIPSDRRNIMQHPCYYRRKSETGSVVTMDNNKFEVNVDVHEFQPEEITVKITGKNEITIEGKHEEKQVQYGFISRHIVRKYVIPKGHDMERVESELSSDGILTFSVPIVKRAIPIILLGRPALAG